jgi:hypothetical protein
MLKPFLPIVLLTLLSNSDLIIAFLAQAIPPK